MKYYYPTLFLFFLHVIVKAQTTDKVTIGTIETLHSEILHEDRKIWVHVPHEEGSVFSKKKYPVIYLLDGDAHFYSVVGMMHQLSSVNGNNVCPEMIVVAIPNTNRTRDLTPTHVVSDPPYMDSTSSKYSGGAERFTAFLEKELIPHIDSLYPTEPYKMLIGHSFGGLFAMNTFVHHTNLFNSYVVIDPSMWWDNKRLLSQAKDALGSQKYAGKSLFMGIANTMNQGMDVLKVPKDTSTATRHIRSILVLDKYFTANKQNQLRYESKYYNDDTHGSAPLITEYDALHFIFKDYALRLTNDEYAKSDTSVASKIEAHYKKLTKQFGYEVNVPESMINSMGYRAMSKKDYVSAEYFFKLNVANYPESYNVFDSLGDLYEAKNDKINAIASFKKALSIQETAETRTKFDKLQGK